MSDGPSLSPLHRFFRASLLILGSVIAITLALQLLSQIWTWIVLILGLGIMSYLIYVSYRWWRDRHR